MCNKQLTYTSYTHYQNSYRFKISVFIEFHFRLSFPLSIYIKQIHPHAGKGLFLYRNISNSIANFYINSFLKLIN